MAPADTQILEPLRRTLGEQQQQTRRLTQQQQQQNLQSNQTQRQERRKAYETTTFDDDDQQLGFDDLAVETNSSYRNPLKSNQHNDSNRWQWIHYYQNNTQLKLTPTFHELALHNIDHKTTDFALLQLENHQQQQPSQFANLTQRAHLLLSAPINKTQSLIESIKSKLAIINNRLATKHATTTKPAHWMDHLAQLSCDSGEMVIRLNFTDPFRGVVYPDHNRLSPCRFFGDGHHNYELRLPLRGCGTRQVAPRVFVNDVIVRFHKTLELEEDEVKTLICRYPPPLDAANTNLAAGSGLVHELGNAIDSNRRPSSTAATGDSHLGHHQPFELVDPSSGRPTSRLGIGQPPVETFGELLAPSSGRPNLSPADRILHRQHQQNQNEQLLSTMSSSSGIKQLNSRLFQPPEPARTLLAGTNQSANSSTSASFFDRLTSIELLFLISSLMFLVLLAFGLAGSYYCFSRRNRRESPTGPKLLGRHRRRSYFNSPGSLLATADTTNSTGPSYQHNHYQRNQRAANGTHLVTGQPPTSYNHQDLYGTSARNPTSYYHRYLQQTQTAPSSPDDSDVSGQNLLPQAANNDSTAARFNYAASNMPPVAPSAHYQSSTLRPYHNHLQHQVHSMNGPISSVVGRRTLQQNDRRPFGSATLRSSANEFESIQPNQQPGLLLAGGASTLGRRANRLALNPREPLVNVTGDHNQRQQPHHQSHHHHHHHHNQHHHRHGHTHQLHQQPKRALPLANQTIAANMYYAQMRHAKSLQQLRSDDDQHQLVDDQQQQKRRPDDDWRRPSTQNQNYLNDDKIRQKQQQHFFDTSTLTRSNTKRRNESSDLRVLDLSGGSTTSSASDSELELTSEQRRAEQHPKDRPKLILKSIEDSFVTNLTEIYEQEYLKRDSTRPLSMAEWRSRQPGRQQTGGNLTTTTTTDDQQVNDDDDDEHDGDDAARTTSPSYNYQPGQTNLRSLTELDVNFAKSLLRPTLVEQPKRETVRMVGGGSSGQAQWKQHEQKPTEAPANIAAGPTTTGASSSISGPHATGVTSQQQQSTNSMDDDLVISPEYNCGQLKLRQDDKEPKRDGASSPANSHKSISYV